MNTVNARIYALEQDACPVWYPFSDNSEKMSDRLNVEKGEGIFLYDNSHKRYYDVTSGNGNALLGYSNPQIQGAISKQLYKLPCCSLVNDSSTNIILAGGMLVQFVGENMKQVVFGETAMDSVESAVEIMKKYWENQGVPQKSEVIYLSPLMEEMEIEDKKKIIECNTDQLAGIVVQPINTLYGINRMNVDDIRKIVEICRENEVLVTIDETNQGFYTTGSKFYFQKIEIVPDLLCLSKGMTAGYMPMSAVLVGERVYENFKSTLGRIDIIPGRSGNLLSCSALIATLEELEKIDGTEKLKEKAEHFNRILREEITKVFVVKEICNEGFLYSIVYSETLHEINYDDVMDVVNRLKGIGILVEPGRKGMVLMPSLIMREEEWLTIIKCIGEVLKKLN